MADTRRIESLAGTALDDITLIEECGGADAVDALEAIRANANAAIERIENAARVTAADIVVGL